MKVSKQSVNYRKSDSESVRCGTCIMARPFPVGHCTLVQGLIEPDDVCDRWEDNDN